MNELQYLNSTNGMRTLTDVELDFVIGGNVPLLGYGPARLNVSLFSVNAPLDPTWELVGLAGHL